MENRPPQTLLSGSRLTRNSVINLLGQGIPFFAAIFAIPLLIHGMGTDRFGVLTLAWMVIGYFSLFDLGLGRALTQAVAVTLTHERPTEAPPVVWMAIALMSALGLLGTVAMTLIAPWLARSLLKIPERLQVETLHSFYILAGAIPFVIVSSGLVGLLSAFQRFAIINAVRIPAGLFGFLAPLMILPYSKNLVPIVAMLVAGRVVACGVYAMACWRVVPHTRSRRLTWYADIKPLFHFGAWMTVTNVAGPLMVYLDRFVIGAIVSIAAVAYYATPYEMVTKLLILPGATLAVLFPAFAASHAQDPQQLYHLFARATKYIALLLFPAILVIVAFGGEGLQWWLGSEFARQSTRVLQCLAIGVFANAIAQMFATMIQGIGRPDLSAKLHMVELPLYLPILLWAVRNYGILGAAIVWTGRVILDGVLLIWISTRVLPANSVLLKRMSLGLLAALGALIVPLFVVNLAARSATALVVAAMFTLVTWFLVFGNGERAFIKSRLGFAVAE